jgi:hypothetical protein
MAVNWNVVGHVIVGTVITASQAIALADPNPQVVSVCHIVALVAAQIGSSLGVWQVSSSMNMKKALLAANCNNCGKPAFQPPEPPAPEPKKEEPKAAA